MGDIIEIIEPEKNPTLIFIFSAGIYIYL